MDSLLDPLLDPHLDPHFDPHLDPLVNPLVDPTYLFIFSKFKKMRLHSKFQQCSSKYRDLLNISGVLSLVVNFFKEIKMPFIEASWDG